MSQPALRLVSVDGEISPDAPSYADALALLDRKDELIVGLDTTIKSQAGLIGRLKRQLEEADPRRHPLHAEMADLIERWKGATGHPKAKQSKDRFEVIKARLKDGYTIEQLQLAVDGIGAMPYVVNGQRVSEGQDSQRHDSLSLALKGGENVERFAVLGYRARKAS